MEPVAALALLVPACVTSASAAGSAGLWFPPKRRQALLYSVDQGGQLCLAAINTQAQQEGCFILISAFKVSVVHHHYG